MKYRENIVTIQVQGSQMLGIVTSPVAGTCSIKKAMLIVTGGAQYRVGSHRQFTRMARELAVAGYSVMRFDMPGMGDSPSAPVPFDQTMQHISAALSALVYTVGIQNIYLWGLCDGASASLLYMQATRDERVAGLVLLNPWVRSDISIAKVHIKHYYSRRLLEIDFWRKLVRGKIGFKAARNFLSSLRSMIKPFSHTNDIFQNAMAQGWVACQGPILLLLSECDFTAQEFKEYILENKQWVMAIKNKPSEQYVLPEADHTCSQFEAHRLMVNHTITWLNSLG